MSWNILRFKTFDRFLLNVSIVQIKYQHKYFLIQFLQNISQLGQFVQEDKVFSNLHSKLKLLLSKKINSRIQFTNRHKIEDTLSKMIINISNKKDQKKLEQDLLLQRQRNSQLEVQIEKLNKTVSQLENKIQDQIVSRQVYKNKCQKAQSLTQSLNQTVSKLKKEKDQLTIELKNQTLKSKDKIRNLQSQIRALNIDLKSKIQTQQQQKRSTQYQIKRLSQQLTQHKHEIQLKNQQIEHLKNQNQRRLNQFVYTLNQADTEKMILLKKVNQLKDEIIRLKDEFKLNQQKFRGSNLSTDEEKQKIRQEIKQLTNKQKETQNYFEGLVVDLKSQHEKQKELFQKETIKRIEELTVKFNETNQKLNEEKISCQRESIRLSSFLVTIYQAMNKMNEFYKTNLSKQYFRTEDHKLILESFAVGSILNQKQCHQVLMYSVKTIKALQTLIRLSQKNTKDKLQLYQNKINNILTQINSLENDKNLKQNLKQYLKSLPVKKQNQEVNLPNKLEYRFDKFVRKIADLIKQSEVQQVEIINNVKKQYKQQQAEDNSQIKMKIQKYKNDHQKESKVEDTLITYLKRQNQNILQISRSISSQFQVLNKDLCKERALKTANQRRIIKMLRLLDTLNYQKDVAQLIKNMPQLIEPEKTQSDDMTYQLDIALFKFLTRIELYLQHSQMKNVRQFTNLNGIKQHLESNLKEQSQQNQEKIKNQTLLKQRDNQIKKLKQELSQTQTMMKMKQEELKKTKAQLSDLKDQTQSRSIQMNKKFREEKEKLQSLIQQLTIQNQELQDNLQISNKKISRLQNKSSISTSSFRFSEKCFDSNTKE